jgi:hypothetical protein
VFRTSDCRHMSDLIPFILQEEQAQIKKEMDGKYISVIFDAWGRHLLLCYALSM